MANLIKLLSAGLPWGTSGAGRVSGNVDGDWGRDTSVVRDQTIDLIVRTHFVAAPVVATGVLIYKAGLGAVIGVAVYAVTLVMLSWIRLRDHRVLALAVVDLVAMGMFATTGAATWTVMLVPAAAAVSVGWLVGRRTTGLLWSVAVLSMGGSALVAAPDAAAPILLAFAATTAGLSFNNLRILGDRRHSVLSATDFVESLPVIVWESDPAGDQLVRLTGQIEAVTGYKPSEWIDMTVEQRVHPDDVERYRGDRTQVNVVGEAVVSEIRLLRADGTDVFVREVIRLVDSDGTRLLRGVTLDVAEEAGARVAVDRLAAVVDNQLDPLVLVAPRSSPDLEPTVLHMNPAFAKLAAIEPDIGPHVSVGVGDRLWDVAPWMPRSVRADLDDLVSTGRASDRDDLSIATPRGTRNFDFEILPLPDGSAAIQFTDVTDRKHAIELIRHQAFHDPLTALPNRTLLFDRLSQAMAAIDRDGSSVGLLLLDLNQFKEINDTLGHAYGDQLLSTIAGRIALMVRPQDTVARLGGDEFAMVVTGATEAQMDEIAQRVGDEVRRAVTLGGIEVEVTASIGGAVAPLHGSDPHVLLQRADVAMYDAKHSGRSYRLYVPDDDRHSVDRLTLMGELKGLLDDELRVWYQPKIDLRSGRVAGLEALARWQHPRMGLLGPGQFIELCELSGAISELTFRVLDLSLAAMAEWPSQRVAVNVPVRNLYDRMLPSIVARKLEENGIEPERLTLEITESEIMGDHRTVIEVLEELHDLGIGISIDDFGTGFSSLTHLRRLPVQEIKIDQSFVSGMLDNENDYMIARSIVDLAHNLGHQVVAEGIEDTATLTLLRELGCDIGQGYLFARPGPIERIRNQIESGPAIDHSGSLLWRERTGN